jgi:ATP-dependent RNA helicase RhlE
MEKQTFDGLGIKPEILAVLDKLNFTTPTPIQSQSIPVALKGQDIIGIAQTGTGKTLAFGIPLLQQLAQSQDNALIILPTRELALQVRDSLDKIARNFNLRSVVLIGGDNISRQMRELKNNPRIIISTPGRLIDHLERKTVNLSKVTVLVLDEADRMFDMGFAPQVQRVLREVPKQRQTMLFSATMPPKIIDLANTYMRTPLRVEVAPAGSATENVTHEIFFVKEGMKLPLLESLLKDNRESVLVFSRTKFGAKRIALTLRKMGYTSTEIHSNRTLAQRMRALAGFKSGQYQVMVATDIAARGIDVKGIGLVVNYDLPSTPEDYVHRIGRTGRAEALGHAVSFATPAQRFDIRMIERLIKKELPISELPELQKLDPALTAQEDAPRERGGFQGRGERASGGRNTRRPKSNDGRSYGRKYESSGYGNTDNFYGEKKNFFGKVTNSEGAPKRENFYAEGRREKPQGKPYGSPSKFASARPQRDNFRDSERRSYGSPKAPKTEGSDLFQDKPYEAYKKKNFGDKRKTSFGKPFGEKKTYSGGDQRQSGERKRSSSSKSYSSPKKSFGQGAPSRPGGHSNFGRGKSPSHRTSR